MNRITVLAFVMGLASIPAFAQAMTETTTFDVKAMGAVGDGVADETLAIQKAIDACGNAKGGRVLFPKGKYRSGSVRLRSGVDLHFAKGARLIGTTDLDAYLGFESKKWGKSRWNRGLIVGEGLEDIAITGAGLIDGNRVFDPKGEAKMRGPHTVLLSDCHNVVLEGVTIRDSANYAFLFYGSSKVRVRKATFEGGWDGVHFRGKADSWNRDVRISNCRFFTGDDCIAGHYIQDGVVEDCLLNSSCNGVRLIGPARGVTFVRCRFFGPGRFEHRTRGYLHRSIMLAALILVPSGWGPTAGP